MNPFIIAAEAVGPIFFLILAGLFLKKIGWINEVFTRMGSKLVFGVSLPALLILNISSMPRNSLLSLEEVLLLLGLTLFVFFITWIPGAWLLDKRERGVFTQGAFRGNMAIIGLAVIQQVLGEPGLQRGALYAALLMPVYNILAIIAITIPLADKNKEGQNPLKLLADTLIKMLKNPLIIAVAIGLVLFALKWEIPSLIRTPMDYLSRMTLPLALICIGGSLDFSHLKERIGPTLLASTIKVVLLPLITFLIASQVIEDPFSLTTLTLLLGVPTAVSSFPMAQSMGGNHEMAANIVALTTLASIPFLALSISLFSWAGFL